MTNRSLVLGAIATGAGTVRRPLRSRDTELMVAALRTLGVGITDIDGDWVVDPAPFTSNPAQVDVGNAGTVLRFVPPVATLARAPIGFDGDDAVRRRPVAPLLVALRGLGADIDDGGRHAAPFVVRGAGELGGGRVSVDASSSSQLISALLLAGPASNHGIEVRHVSDRAVPNAPHIAMTVEMLRARGASVDADSARWRVAPGRLDGLDETIEPDLSSAAPFLAAGVVTGGQVRIEGWPRSSTQPGARLAAILERFGATTRVDDDGLLVTGPGTLHGADLDLRDAGELTPVIAAIGALASTPSRLTGVDYLRGHETDRLAALARELGALGTEVRELDDGLSIVPRPMRGGVFSTYDDHRLAMAAAVIGTVVPGIEIENVETTAKTLPGFAELWTDMVCRSGADR